MAKEKFSRTKACATKTLYAVMKEMLPLKRIAFLGNNE